VRGGRASRGRRGPAGGEGVGVEGLELDRIGTDCGRGVNEPSGELGVTVVVDTGLSDDEHWPPADLPLAERERGRLAGPGHRFGDDEVVLLVDVHRPLR
jgi:hypothetical protein